MRIIIVTVLALLSVAFYPTALPFVVNAIHLDVPVVIRPLGGNAMALIGEDGKPVVMLDPVFAHSADRDMIGYIVAHELGHLRLGHLWYLARLRPGWYPSTIAMQLQHQMEFEADLFALREGRKAGFDALRGARGYFALYGNGGGLTHPLDSERVRVMYLALGE